MPLARRPARSSRRALPVAELAVTFALLCGGALGASAQTVRDSAHATVVSPRWAFPVRASGAAPVAPDSVLRLRVPNSARLYTAAQIANLYAVPDWFPSHGVMPEVVARGRRPAVYACAYCHLADGRGRPENALLAGMPAAYIEAQVAAIRSGERRPPPGAVSPPYEAMRLVAERATDAEIAVAARYFAALRAGPPRTRIIEADSVPALRSMSGVYALDTATHGKNVDSLGGRLVDVATDAVRHERHDPRVPYLTFVPRGSISRGRAIATTPSAAPRACVGCHGPALRGVGLVPPIAGRAPSYLLRQLLAFNAGTRSTPAAAPMRDVASRLTLDDMIAVAAYAGSLRP